MLKYIQFISVLFIVVCIAACGSSGTTTTADPIYNSPAALAPENTHMGGSVQETPLVLSNTVSTLAGNPEISVLTDGIGTAARFNRPTDITTDGTNFYVADYANYAIRKVSKSGEVTTLQCTDADTGIVTGFNLPFSLAVKADGSQLYVVDAGSNTIRIIDIDTVNNTNKVTTIGSTTGLAGSVDSAVKTDVRFNRPTGITTDGDNLYVTDSGNSTIRRIDLKNNYAVSTLAGTSGTVGSTDGDPKVALFNMPQRITTDGTSLYVTDFNNRTIRKVDILTGAVSTIAGKSGPLETATDGIGSEARFYQPNGITTDGTFLYVTDSYLNTVRRIDKVSPYNVTTISIPDDSLHTPLGITTDGVSLFVADTYTVIRDPKTMLDTYTYSNSIIKID
jgi:DNA-binding beta-propeller fold protein YncE